MQAAVKIVLEPVFEAGFLPCSFGFRPKRSDGRPDRIGRRARRVPIRAEHRTPHALTLGDPEQSPAGSACQIRAVTLAPDGNWLASGSDDRTVRIGDAVTG